MVQLPEAISFGKYKTIAEISKERIRRAAAKIKEENPDYKGDLGFKVFKLDSSNIHDWDPDRNDVVFRDSAFANDITKTNMTTILEQNEIKHVRSL